MRKNYNKNIISEERNSDFKCITNFIERVPQKYKRFTDRIVIYLDDDIRNGRSWVFYQNANNSDSGGRWFEFNESTKVKDGRWYCDGEDNFFYETLTETYSSLTNVITPLSTQTPTQTQTPTNTSTQTTEPEADDTFPLKKGKSGPEVVQLQNFLNDKGTGKKLVTDGIFGDLTYNKLVKYQEDKKLIE
jgi:hypothetical protein